jgi:hypothetical protein
VDETFSKTQSSWILDGDDIVDGLYYISMGVGPCMDGVCGMDGHENYTTIAESCQDIEVNGYCIFVTRP